MSIVLRNVQIISNGDSKIKMRIHLDSSDKQLFLMLRSFY